MGKSMEELKSAYNAGRNIVDWNNRKNMDDFNNRVHYLSVENSLATVEQRLTITEQKLSELSNILFEDGNKTFKEKRNQSLHYESEDRKLILVDAKEYENLINRSLVLLDKMRNNDDLRIQIQYTAILIKKIDKIRTLDVVKNNKNRMKIFAFLRLVLKINSDEVLFNNEQIDLFYEAFERIEKEEDSKYYVKQYTFSFMDVGLTTMPSWE